MSAFIRKHPIITAVLAVLLCVGIVTGIGFTTAGFTESPIKRNPDNLITVGDDTNIDLESRPMTNGLNVNLNKDNGAVTLKGDLSKAATNTTLVYATVKLDAGTYCLTSGYASTGTGTVCMTVMNGSEILAYADMADTGEPGVFTLDAETTVVIKIVVAPHNCNATLKPVLVEGEKKGAFYA